MSMILGKTAITLASIFQSFTFHLYQEWAASTTQLLAWGFILASWVKTISNYKAKHNKENLEFNLLYGENFYVTLENVVNTSIYNLLYNSERKRHSCLLSPSGGGQEKARVGWNESPHNKATSTKAEKGCGSGAPTMWLRHWSSPPRACPDSDLFTYIWQKKVLGAWYFG